MSTKNTKNKLKQTKLEQYLYWNIRVFATKWIILLNFKRTYFENPFPLQNLELL